MESRQGQPAAHFVGSPCMRGPTCPYLRRRCCLFFHLEDESASVVGQDLHSFASLMARIARLELEVAQFVGLPVPQIMKDLVDGVQSAPQEPNQECRDSADAVRRQGCHDGYGHQQGGRSVCAVAATGPTVEVEDRGSPAVAVARQICAAGDQPGDQACRDFAVQVHPPDEPFPPIPEEIHEVNFHEVTEVVKAVRNVPQEHISERTGEQTTGTSGSDCAGDRGKLRKRSS